MSIRKYTCTGTCTICTQWQMDIKFSFFQYDTNFDLIWFFCRKAIKFYMYDICVNPLRLDSWAGLALARMYQLEQKLNSVSASMWKEFLLYFYVSSLCFFKRKYFYVLWELRLSPGILPFQTDLKLDVSLQKRSRAALRCFERSVDIEDAYGKLWMEYGSLSYQLHTHSSRQLNFHEVGNSGHKYCMYM